VNRHTAYNQQSEDVKKLEEEGRIFVIRPKEKLQIDRLEKKPERLVAVHALGLADANAQMDALRAYLNA